MSDWCRRFRPTDPEELKHEIFSALLERPHDQIIAIHQNGNLLGYLNMIARNMSVDQSKSKRPENLEDVAEETPVEDNTDTILGEFEKMDMYFTELVKAVVKHGSIRAAARAIGIPKDAVRRDMIIVRDHFKKSVCY